MITDNKTVLNWTKSSDKLPSPEKDKPSKIYLLYVDKEYDGVEYVVASRILFPDYDSGDMYAVWYEPSDRNVVDDKYVLSWALL